MSSDSVFDAAVSAEARYEIQGEHARGGVGRVLVAQDKRLRRSAIAIKEMRHANAELERRFQVEAIVTARLEHPGVVPVYDCGRWENGEPFYAMKLVEGQSLATLLKSTETVEDRLALLPRLVDVAETMAYAHAHRVVHRDLKPSNVVIGAYGETVVVDWGLAKLLDAEEPANSGSPAAANAVSAGRPEPHLSQATAVGQVLGTPAYMPPEQARGEPVDERADVYALGAIMYHVLTGAAPYRGKTTDEVLQEVLHQSPAPLEDVVPVRSDLVAIVAKAMERDPAARYSTATEFRDDLRRYQEGQYVKAHRYSVYDRVRRRWRASWKTVVAIGAVGVLGRRSDCVGRPRPRRARRRTWRRLVSGVR